MANTEALKLPDPLLVRYFREGRIDRIKCVHQDPDRNCTVTLKDGTLEPWLYLVDVGWIPDQKTAHP